jgi:hypothetical protein
MNDSVFRGAEPRGTDPDSAGTNWGNMVWVSLLFAVPLPLAPRYFAKLQTDGGLDRFRENLESVRRGTVYRSAYSNMVR